MSRRHFKLGPLEGLHAKSIMTYYDETHLLGVAATQAHGDEITAVTLPEMEVVACFADAKAPRERLGKGQRRHGCILWVQDELDGPATTPIIAEEKQKQSIITRKQLDQVPVPGCCPLLGGITVSADARNFGKKPARSCLFLSLLRVSHMALTAGFAASCPI